MPPRKGRLSSEELRPPRLDRGAGCLGAWVPRVPGWLGAWVPGCLGDCRDLQAPDSGCLQVRRHPTCRHPIPWARSRNPYGCLGACQFRRCPTCSMLLNWQAPRHPYGFVERAHEIGCLQVGCLQTCRHPESGACRPAGTLQAPGRHPAGTRDRRAAL